MSPNTSKNVPEIVEKYRAKYPELESARLRPIIRNGNPELFKKIGNPNYEANKKKLTRCLKDAFKSQLSKESKNTKYNHPISQNKDNDDALKHSKSLVLTARDAETELDLRVDQYGPDIILRMFLLDEHSDVPLTSFDYYFLQHIETGYPEISKLVEKWKTLSNHPKEMQDISNLIVEKIDIIIDGVKLGTPLLGHCDCCP